MEIKLLEWDESLKKDLINVCNGTKRDYLSNSMPFPYTESDAEQRLKFMKDNADNGVYRAIFADGKCVGNISVQRNGDVCCKDCELGYALLRTESSKGIMTQAVKQVCKIAFDELDVIRITAEVFSPNEASKKVLLKNGFILEGIKKNAVYKNGEIYDLFIYGLYR